MKKEERVEGGGERDGRGLGKGGCWREQGRE